VLPVVALSRSPPAATPPEDASVRALNLTAVALLAVLPLLSACTGNVFELSVGDCYLAPDDPEEITDVEVVDCDEPHDHEVFHTFELPDGDLPDDEELVATIEQECTGEAFTSYVGSEYATSEIFLSPLTPSEETWDAGDREVVCTGVLEPGSGEQLTGSFEASGR
jgi:hypothetical protein